MTDVAIPEVGDADYHRAGQFPIHHVRRHLRVGDLEMPERAAKQLPFVKSCV